jgi:type IX secretion system PorP/SprF family membrane protein
MRTCTGLLAFVILLLPFAGKTQNYSVYNSYFLNPYLYNPAEASTDFSCIQVNHRQQWYGFEGAPKTLTATFTTQLNESRVGLGAKASSYSRGILQTNDMMLTYVYGMPSGPKNTFYFALSGGAISNNIDIAQADYSDPALLTYSADNIQPIANFGMLYRSANGLNFGISLPQLIGPKYNSSKNFENPTIVPADNIIVSAYYKRKVDGKIVSKKKRGIRTKVKTKESIAPLEFYTLYKYSKIGVSQAEATLKVNFTQRLWLAGLYRLNYGFGASVGFSFSNITVNYAYEPGSAPQPQFSTGSHEINLAISFGKQKKLKRAAPTLRSTLKTDPNIHHARFEQSLEDPDHEPGENLEKKHYYVVVKSFADFTSADKFKQKLTGEKFNANIFYYEKDKKYYVHVFDTPKQADAHSEAHNLKLYTKLKDARVLIVTVPKN